jgi:hypothetical protein
MIARLALLIPLLPLAAVAQIQVFVLNGTTLTLAGSTLQVGTAAVGDSIQTQFRVKNSGSLDVALSVSLSGDAAFNIQCQPAPYVPPGLESAFCTAFTPVAAGSYAATLRVNGISISLTGNVQSSAQLLLSGTTTPLLFGSTINFGSVAIQQPVTQGFVLNNASPSSLLVKSVAVSGAGFSGPAGATFPASIGSGRSVKFQVTFTPQTGTPYQGTLTVDGRSFVLAGQGLDPPLPSASIVFGPGAAASGQQDNVSIPLASASAIAGSGTLKMSFAPAADIPPGTSDPAILFVAGPHYQESVSIAPGATTALIDGQSSIGFQTGTTAGTITFSLSLGFATPQQTTLTIPPGLISLDSVTAVRIPGELDISIAGFDNTYTASGVTFTFYDLKNNPLTQGAMNVDATGEFQPYFKSTQYGGMFQMLLKFPVAGDITQIGSVAVRIVNSVGTTSWPNPITITN